MPRFTILTLLFVTAPFIPATADKEEDIARLAELPMTMPEFRMEDYTGKEHTLSDYTDKRLVVVFLQMNGCPIVRQSLPYLEELRQEYEDDGVAFLMINCNNFDDNEMVAEEAKEYNVKIPILMDHDQVFANALDVRRSAESFVVDPKTREILYRGMADDRFDYGLQRSNPQHFWVRDILEGEAPETTKRVTRGCLMDLVELPETVSYDEEVAPVLQKTFGDCVESIDESPDTATRKAIWDSLLLKRAQLPGCETKPFEITPYDAQTLMTWLGPYPHES